MAQLNERLATQQEITQEQRGNLDLLYEEMDILFRTEKEDPNIKVTGQYYAEDMKKLEFKLQENWNFPQDELYHTWWNKFSNCKCPKLDNDERFGRPKIITCDCPLHKHICLEEEKENP